MKKLTIDEIKSISLDGLKYFHSFCEINHLRYYLAYGTLLGAIRHHGFIPWDDDIDIVMPREDFNNLILLKDKIDNQNWELMSANTNCDYKFQFAKLCNKETVYYPSRFKSGLLYGVPLDIFPLDLVESQSDAINKQSFFRRLIPVVLVFNGEGYKPDAFDVVKGLIKYLFFGGYNRNVIKFHKEMLECKHGKYYKSFFAPTGDLWEKEWFDNGVKMEFEGVFFNVPANYDEILSTTYGDYMKLPPEEERVYKHEIEAYYK